MSLDNLSQTEIDELLRGKAELQENPLRKEFAANEFEPHEGFEHSSSQKGFKESPVVRPAVFRDLTLDDTGAAAQVSGMEVLMDVPLSVSAELGKARCFVRDLLNLTVGSVVELDRTAGDPVDILVNGKPFALGEVVVIDENFGVRIREILGKADKIDQ